MDFGLNPRQQELQKNLRGLFAKEIAPKAADVDAAAAFPADNFKVLAEAGFLGLTIPKEFGGAGDDVTTAITAIEELATACASTAMCAGASSLVCGGAIEAFGTAALKKKWLPEIASGKAVGSYALTDPSGGGLSDIKMTAVKSGAGYEITGSKSLATNGANAAVVIVIALLDGKLSAFAVEKSLAGFGVGQKIETMGLRGTALADINLDKCIVPAENLLGAEGDGEKIAAAMLNRARLHTAVLSVGIGRAAYEEGKKRAETRVSGGKPLGAYQEVSFRITDMFIESDTARQLCYLAAWTLDEGAAEAATSVSVAKLYASEMAVRNASRAVQIFGGAGYTKASAVERIYRDAKYTEIGDGANEIQRMLIAEDVLKD